MVFSILIYASPYQAQSVHTAYRFAKSALQQGHTVERVFFYGDSVLCASQLSAPPRDEQDIFSLWKTLAEEYELDLVVCIAAALKRGILDSAEAKRHEKPAHTVEAPFELSGLGQLTEAMMTSDRLMTFGD